MASSESINRKINGTKNLKVHFDIPESEDRPSYHQPYSISSNSSDYSSIKSTDTQSPTTQTMDPSGGYDPNRIPSKIFASKPTNPMEWSLASSESLFSLHIGNMNSFSTLNKSEELVRINEEFVMERKSTEIDTPEEKREVVMGKIETSSSPENKQAGNNSTTISDHHLDDNMVVYTNGSFQFPILASNSGEAMESEKQETKKAIEPHSPISKTAPKPGGTRDWCHCFCFCSTCY